jgi:hypothetical protein
MKRSLLAGLLAATLVAPVSAQASGPILDLQVTDPAPRAGELEKVTLTVTDDSGPVADLPVRFEMWGAISQVVSDLHTDANGQARVIVRGWSFGWPEETSVVAAINGSDCSESPQDCVSLTIDWMPTGSRCTSEGFAVQLPNGGIVSQLPPEEGPCDWYYRYEQLVDRSGVVVAGVEQTPYDGIRAFAASYDAGLFRVSVAEAAARQRCLDLDTARVELNTGLVTIWDLWGNRLYRATPTPGETIEVPGIAKIILNTQNREGNGSDYEMGSVTAIRIDPVVGPPTIIGHVHASVHCQSGETETLLGAGGDAHTDYPTGPAHLSFEVYEDPFGGPAFVRRDFRYSDARRDPPGEPSRPFTCYAGTIAGVGEVYGHRWMGARVGGTITCTGIGEGDLTLRYVAEILDLSQPGPVDQYNFWLIDDQDEVIYTGGDLTSEGDLWVAEY